MENENAWAARGKEKKKREKAKEKNGKAANVGQ